MRQKIRLGRMNILMAVKDKVLAALEQARGERLTGGRLAETLGVSTSTIRRDLDELVAEHAIEATLSRFEGIYRQLVGREELAERRAA